MLMSFESLVAQQNFIGTIWVEKHVWKIEQDIQEFMTENSSG